MSDLDYELETGIIERKEEHTELDNSNHNVYEFMLNAWNAATATDAAIYKSCYTDNGFDMIAKWMNALDAQFNFEKDTVLYYFKWACRYRFSLHLNPVPIKYIRIKHDDIIYNHKKIHTNFISYIYKDDVVINVPITETVDYANQ